MKRMMATFGAWRDLRRMVTAVGGMVPAVGLRCLPQIGVCSPLNWTCFTLKRMLPAVKTAGSVLRHLIYLGFCHFPQFGRTQKLREVRL